MIMGSSRVVFFLSLVSSVSLGFQIDFKETRGQPDVNSLRRRDILIDGAEASHSKAISDVLSLQNAVPIFSGLVNIDQVQYQTNITLNNQAFIVALDVGGADVWIDANVGQGQYRDLGLPAKLVYPDGFVQGSIGVAPLSFGTYKVDEQAFVNITQNTRTSQDPRVSGLLGLGLNTWANSTIGNLLRNANNLPKVSDLTKSGSSIIQNIYSQRGYTTDFVSILLGRDGLENSTGGTIGLGEHPDNSLQNGIETMTKMPQNSPGFWTILLDGITVDGKAIDLKSTVKGVSSGVVALVDSTTASGHVPASLINAIYSKIPGAKILKTAGNQGVYQVPCETTSSLVLSFGGQQVPIHPLDLSTVIVVGDPADSNGFSFTICGSSLVGDFTGSNATAPYDLILGNALLRNVYSLFDSGDYQAQGNLGAPYMQLLSTTNSTTAAAEVASIRGTNMKGMPPELTDDLLAKLVASANGTDTGFGSSPSSMSDLSEKDSQSIEELKNYAMATVALLVLNALLAMGIITIGLMFLIRRASDLSPRNGAPHYVPVKQNRDPRRADTPVYESLRGSTSTGIATPGNYSDSGV